MGSLFRPRDVTVTNLTSGQKVVLHDLNVSVAAPPSFKTLTFGPNNVSLARVDIHSPRSPRTFSSGGKISDLSLVEHVHMNSGADELLKVLKSIGDRLNKHGTVCFGSIALNKLKGRLDALAEVKNNQIQAAIERVRKLTAGEESLSA